MENPIKMDDLGVPPFKETSISGNQVLDSCDILDLACIVPLLLESASPRPG